MLKTICVFTNFDSFSQAYSLNRVVMNQIRMLVDHGYKPVVIVGEHFIPEEDYALPQVILKRIPSVPVYNEVKMDSSFDQDVMGLEKALSSALEGVDVVLTHDIIYQPACVKHLVAAKRIAKRRPELRWLHWIHSATSPYTLQNLRPLFVDEYAKIIGEKFPNSFYVYFNHYSIPRIAQNFKVNDQDVKVVPHPTDIRTFYKIEDDSWELIKRHKILSADVICTYPIRLDRGKQVEKVIKTIAAFKQLDKTVRLIVCDFHSTGGDKVTYREECKAIAIDWGLTEDELIWTSEQKADWNTEIPYKNVADFMKLSNVFVGASTSESYSLITQEAGLSGVTMTLNRDFPPFRDIFGWEPHQVGLSSNIDALTGLDGDTTTKIEGSEKTWYLNVAMVMNTDLENERALHMKTKLRQTRNMDYVFEHFLEPLFSYEEPIKETK